MSRLARTCLAPLTALLATALSAPRALRAQVPIVLNTPCRPPAGSNEAKLLAFYSAPIAFSPGGGVEPLGPGAVRLGIEATYVPSPRSSIRHPDRCYTPEKTENTQLSRVFPRPRVAVGLPGGIILEASYLPPISVADATPNLGSAALSRVFPLSQRGTTALSLLVRAHGTIGRVRGPITCPRSTLQQTDIGGPCYGTSPSNDTFKPNMFGGEVGVLGARSDGRLSGYVGGGVTRLLPRFQVHFDFIDGIHDRTPIEVDLTRAAAFAGASYRIAHRVDIAAELYSVPSDATTIRFGAGYRLR